MVVVVVVVVVVVAAAVVVWLVAAAVVVVVVSSSSWSRSQAVRRAGNESLHFTDHLQHVWRKQPQRADQESIYRIQTMVRNRTHSSK